MLIDKKTETLIRDYIPSNNDISAMAEFFASLSDQTRIRIISALSISPMCVTDLSNVLRLNQTTLSHQLKNLRQAGILQVYKQGRISFYSIKDRERVLDILFKSVTRDTANA